MKKTKIGILVGISVLLVLGIVVAQTGTMQEARYLVKSNNVALKAMFGVQHNFKEGFTTDLSPGQLKVLEKFSIEIEEVPLYYILAKPICGDSNVHPSEQCGEPGLSECPTGYTCESCKCVEETTTPEEPIPEGRTCYPSVGKPWGIVKVNGGSGGAGINVAVLDTGVYTDHLDLTRRIADCKDFTKGPRVKNGCDDGYGHGTHVAGTVAADGGADGKGIFGVAPEADIFAYKVCGNDGSCWADDIATAIRYAADKDAEIISMSLGGSTESSLIKNAIDYATGKDVLVVAAAGNYHPTYNPSNVIQYPAANPQVVAVAAFDSSDEIADFSSRGANDGDWTIEAREIEFATPGVSVESTFNDGCYKVWSGTSMSTPHVAGIAARDWKGNAIDTRTYLQGLAKYYTEYVKDYGLAGDDIEAGFGLPIAQ